MQMQAFKSLSSVHAYAEVEACSLDS